MVLSSPSIFGKTFEEPERDERVTQIRHEEGLFSGIIPLTGTTSPYTLDLTDIQIANLDNLSVAGDVEWTGTFEPSGGISGNLDMNDNNITELNTISGANLTLGSDIDCTGSQITAVDFLSVAGDIEFETMSFSAITSYLFINPSSFFSENPDTEDVTIRADRATANAPASFSSGVELPHGAVVTAVIMYGNAGTSDETATLVRANSAGSINTLTTSAIGTADTSVSNATIDNQNYSYSIGTSTLSATDSIYGARITYTFTTL